MTKTIETAEAPNAAATSTAVAPSSNHFPLSSDEQKKISEIAAELCPDDDGMNKMRDEITALRPKAAEMQQYATEASKILAATDERLKKYENAGFWKRFWFRISGKTGAMERANQRDLANIQKLAWWYLMELQNQNLLQARAIVVIRNNLKDMKIEQVQTNEMINTLQKRLDARLKNLEYSLEEVKWVAYLDGRKAEFPDPKKFPVICALQIVFDYLKTFRDFAKKRRDERIWSEPLDIIAPVRAALAKFGIDDKFGLDCQIYTVQAFIDALFAEEQKLENGRTKIKNTIKLWDCLEEQQLIEYYDFALKTVSGIAFNALFNYNEIMDKVGSSLKKAVKKDNPMEVLRQTVLGSINAPRTEYSIIDLASEIIGGCQIVMEKYSNEKRPEQKAAAESVRELPTPRQIEKCDEEVTDADGSKTGVMSVCLQDVCGTPGKLKDGAKFHINKERVKAMLGDSYLTDYLPDGVSVDVDEDGDWILPKEGTVEFKKRSRNIDESLLGDNPAALELDYDEDDGSFGGCFKVYQVTGKSIASKKFTVKGALIEDVGYGMAHGEDGIGAFAVMIY